MFYLHLKNALITKIHLFGKLKFFIFGEQVKAIFGEQVKSLPLKFHLFAEKVFHMVGKIEILTSKFFGEQVKSLTLFLAIFGEQVKAILPNLSPKNKKRFFGVSKFWSFQPSLFHVFEGVKN